MFDIPVSEESKVKDIEAAADRLHQLSRAQSLTLSPEKSKPSEEEVYDFLNRTVKLAEGNAIDEDNIVTSASFSKNEVSNTEEHKRGLYALKFTYTGIKWETLAGFDKYEVAGSSENLVYFTVSFTSPVKVTSVGKNRPTETKYDKNGLIPIPKDKLQSVQKAIIRLAEIAREQNKDPFAE
ncbi:MAG: hypothetical protein LPK03_10860 [Pontibacter sp.]|nr:hypothetical protein [Pontibacter sp.]